MTASLHIDGYRIETEVSPQRIKVRCYAPNQTEAVGVKAVGPSVTPAMAERMELLARMLAEDEQRARRRRKLR